MSGAQIAGVANAACFLASREGRADVGQDDLKRAIEQGRFGKVRVACGGEVDVFVGGGTEARVRLEGGEARVLLCVCGGGARVWLGGLREGGVAQEGRGSGRRLPACLSHKLRTNNIHITTQPNPQQTYEQHGFVSPARRRRFAVMEASIALAATLLPAIEPVERVTIAPSTKSPIGRTVLKVRGGGREST